MPFLRHSWPIFGTKCIQSEFCLGYFTTLNWWLSLSVNWASSPFTPAPWQKWLLTLTKFPAFAFSSSYKFPCFPPPSVLFHQKWLLVTLTELPKPKALVGGKSWHQSHKPSAHVVSPNFSSENFSQFAKSPPTMFSCLKEHQLRRRRWSTQVILSCWLAGSLLTSLSVMCHYPFQGTCLVLGLLLVSFQIAAPDQRF